MAATLTRGLPVNLFVGPYPPQVTYTLSVVVANEANLMAVQVNRPVAISQFTTRIGTQSGNLDVGVYDDSGNLLASSGSFACPAAAASVNLALGSTISLAPGRRYWFAIAADNATVTFPRPNVSAIPAPTHSIVGKNIATSFPLPATITLPTTNGAPIGLWA